MGKIFEGAPSKGRYTYGQKASEKCSTSWVISEIEVETLIRNYYTPRRMA